eukprot:CAMPEP_0113883748 /NCGR_PEP_ID=MMETSP0780_2-20120614/9795_1 /TAXON_ID=652834 /ORGANISM="Palpitomonas bilix" /LENGTH=430 /DNA_ID=CAMNT_0000871133 /DNA_START=232 /DNA_END=1524 /DNA_ORIENTATION=+ /assembly_acc=CAM_ASM_000599
MAGDGSQKSFRDKIIETKRRAAQKLKQRFGSAEATKDEVFDELHQNYQENERLAKVLIKDFNEYIETVRHLGQISSKMGNTFASIIPRDSGVRGLALQFQDTMTHINENLCNQMMYSLNDLVVKPVQGYLEHFPKAKKLIDQRKSALLDYDAYKDKVKKLQEKQSDKLQRKQDKLTHAAEVFNKLNDEAITLMEDIEQGKDEIFETPVSNLVRCQASFYTKVGDAVGAMQSSEEKAVLKATRHSRLVVPGAADAVEPIAAVTGAAGGSGKGVEVVDIPTLAMDDLSLGDVAEEGSAEEKKKKKKKKDEKKEKEKEKEKEKAKKPAPPPAEKEKSAEGRGAAEAAAEPKAEEKKEDGRASLLEELGDKGGNEEGGGKRVRALFDYHEAGEGILEMNAGDIIEVVQEDGSGWWEGKVRGKQGWFPSNFVEAI